jgi:hypothetical protein
VSLCEGVEQRPGSAGPEVDVLWVAPLLQDLWDLSGGNSLRIDGTHDDVVGSGIADLGLFVMEYTLIKASELVAKLTNSTSCEVPEIPFRKACVLAADPNFATESQIIAHKYPGASHEASRVGLIV